MTNAERHDAAESTLRQLTYGYMDTAEAKAMCLSHGFEIDFRRWLNNEIEALDIETGNYVFLEV